MDNYIYIYIYKYTKGSYGEMVIIIGNGHGDTSSNPGRDWLQFHSTNTLGKGMDPTILPAAMGKIVGQNEFFSLGMETSQGEGKLNSNSLNFVTLCHILPVKRGCVCVCVCVCVNKVGNLSQG